MKIVWVTENFVDVDFPVIRELSERVEIVWFVVHRATSEFYTMNDLMGVKSKIPLVDVRILSEDSRYSHPRSLLFYWRLVSRIKCEEGVDVIYLNITGMPYFHFVALNRLDLNRVVYAAHDVVEHSGMKNSWFLKLYKKYIFKRVWNLHFFSEGQKALFDWKKYGRKNHFVARLLLKNYGFPQRSWMPGKETRFLFFGTIRENKGIRWLIEAVNALPIELKDRFKVFVAGYCDDWSVYENEINDLSVYDLRIRYVRNEEIPDLFSNVDYLLLPYLDVTQSGVLMVGYNYGVPAIVSSFDEFKRDVENGETGCVLDDMSVECLTNLMEKIICEREEQRIRMRENLQRYVRDEFDVKSVSIVYERFFMRLKECGV